jgi:hypothetical protein
MRRCWRTLGHVELSPTASPTASASTSAVHGEPRRIRQRVGRLLAGQDGVDQAGRLDPCVGEQVAVAVAESLANEGYATFAQRARIRSTPAPREIADPFDLALGEMQLTLPN